MKSQTSLVGTEGGIELDTISPVDLDLPLVILPDDAELDDSFGDGGDLKGGLVFRVFLEEGGVFEGGHEL